MKLTKTLWIVSAAASCTLVHAAMQGASPTPWEASRSVLQEADQAAADALGRLALGSDECSTVAALAAGATIASLRADLGLGIASCINEESGTPDKFFACLQELYAEFSGGLEELGEVNEARLDLCGLTGGGIYDPDLDEDEFVDGVWHPFLPLAVGNTWVYEIDTDEGFEQITVTVTDETKCIDDIECIAVRDTVTLDGVFLEDTIDWYAQHQDGTVWYMGEISENFDEEGTLEDIDGSWRAGKDGGLPGIVMLADPRVGVTYRQELLLTEAEDAGTVLATDATITIGLGTFSGCLLTADFTPIEPDALEHKYYAPGIGLVAEVDPKTGETLELVSFTPGS